MNKKSAKDPWAKAGFKVLKIPKMTFEEAEKMALEFWDEAMEAAAKIAETLDLRNIPPSQRQVYRWAGKDIARRLLKEKTTYKTKKA